MRLENLTTKAERVTAPVSARQFKGFFRIDLEHASDAGRSNLDLVTIRYRLRADGRARLFVGADLCRSNASPRRYRIWRARAPAFRLNVESGDEVGQLGGP
jgi:hypothetical protein